VNYYLDFYREERKTAGKKAPEDIAMICKQAGFSCFEIPALPASKSKLYRRLWILFHGNRWWNRLKRTVKKGDVVLYQHPLYGNRLSLAKIPQIQAKGVRFIALIHDLESLRQGIEGIISNNKKTNQLADNDLLKVFNVVICHNDKMRDYLLEQGFAADKVVTLELFDYICAGGHCQNERNTIAIAGNLAKGKSAYIYHLHDDNHNPNLRVNLYGINYEDADNDNLRYQGAYSPEDLPANLKGDYGLVWDGISAETCAGNTGAYLRYNNPHKCSLYLAAGMPVIIWEEAALASFVLENKIGITVKSLYEIEEKINKISNEEYLLMQENCRKLSAKLRSGFYTMQGLKKAQVNLDDQ